MTDFTAHLRFPIPDFLQDPWHAELTTAIRAIDTAIYEALLVQDVDFWLNATTYGVGAIVIDSATGLMWTCAVANTSSAGPVTFAQERVAHPTFWNATATIPQQRGAWTTATSYIPGDFVVESNRYAVCLVAHVSAAAFNTDLAAARWVVLIDLSSLGVGINATAEGTIASAATTDIGGQAPTRLNVTGTVNIASFGVVANTYKILRYSGALTITNSANIILIGGANRVTAAGDIQWISSDNTGKWREIMYTAASGIPLSVPDASDTVKGLIEIATQGEVDAGADTVRAVVPLTLKNRLDALTTSIVNTVLGGVGPTLDTLNEIAIAIGFLAPKANPSFTGTTAVETLTVSTAATVPTPSSGDDDTSVATTAFVNDATKQTKQRFTATGAFTWNRPVGCTYIEGVIKAAGGGGSRTQGGTVNGNSGGSSSFDNIVANGGGGGQGNNGGVGGVSGTGPATMRFAGSDGGRGGNNGGGFDFGGPGAPGLWGNGAGKGGDNTGSNPSNPGAANTGAGGGGKDGGSGGGAGEHAVFERASPASSYTGTIGVGGTAPGTGCSPGGSGYVEITEYYFVP